MDFVIAAQPFSAWALALVIVAAVVGIAVELLIAASILWLVSKLVMPGTGTFRNAWRLLGYNFLLGIAGGAVYFAVNLFAFSFAGSKSGPSPQFIAIVLGLIWLAQIVFTFLIIMHVYEASFWRALEFQLVLLVLGAGLMIGGAMLMMKSMPENAREEMKRMIAEARHGGGFTPPAFVPYLAPVTGELAVPPVTPASPPLPVRTEVTLTEPVQITMMLDGTNAAGTVTLPAGTKLKYFSAEGDRVRVQYLQTVTTIPRKSTDLPPDAP